MKLLVVRHGQTQANAEHRYLGALDAPLNAVGLQQAHETAKKLLGTIDVMYCSPLIRARQTAEVIAKVTGLSFQVVPAFRERNVGVYEGLTKEEAQVTFPELWAKNITRQWDAAPDGGEAISTVFTRVGESLNDVVNTHRQETVLLVAHGFVAKVLRALVLADTSDFFDWQLKNGEILELVVCPLKTAFNPCQNSTLPRNRTSCG